MYCGNCPHGKPYVRRGLRGGAAGARPLFAYICKSKNKKIGPPPPPGQSDKLYSLRPQVQYFLNPRLYVLNVKAFKS